MRLRFQFRSARRPAEEHAAEDLLGAEHPVPPFVQGIAPTGLARIPLFQAAGGEPSETVREIDLVPPP